nr:sperm head and tail associated protein-like [Meriones unguiculatus]
MTSSPPFFLELSAPAPSPLAKGPNNYPSPSGSPSSCRKESSPVFAHEVPLAPRKELNDHLSCTAGLSPNAGKRFTNPPYSREPFSCLTVPSPCLPRRIPSPPPQPILSSPPPPQGRCSFEPFSPLLGRLYSQEPVSSSPSFDQFSLQGSPASHQRNHYCNLIGSPRPQRPCPPTPYPCYSSPVTSPPLIHQPPRNSPVTSPQLTHISLETCPVLASSLMPVSQGSYAVISPLLTHKPLITGLKISPPLAYRPVESRLQTSTSISHRTGPMISHWSSERSYNDPLLSQPAGNPYHGHPKPPDSCEPKPQLGVSGGENGCGPPLSSQAGMSSSPIAPQQGTFHYSHLCPESQIAASRGPYCVINLPPESAGSLGSPQPQSLHKSFLSWEAAGSSYLLVTPGAVISGPPCPTEPPLAQCPYPSLYFPPPLGSQFLAPPPSPRGYSEIPVPTPVPPQVKSPKSTESRRVPYRCRSLGNTLHHPSFDHPKSQKSNTSPQPISQSFGLSSPLVEPSITTASSPCPKELPQETAVGLQILKAVAPACYPHCLPCNSLLPTRYSKSTPRRPPPVSPCNTHMYSVIPPTTHSFPLSSLLNHSTALPQCPTPPVVPPCGTYSAPRGPPPTPSKPAVPPCSTHIYSFIPLRTPFDPRCLPVVHRARLCPNTIPCGFHTYAVASPVPHKDPPQIPYGFSLPSSKTSTCSITASCSSTIIISECGRSESQCTQQKSQNKSLLRSKSKSPQRRGTRQSRSRSRSSSPLQSLTQEPGENTSPIIKEAQSEKGHHNRGRKKSKSPKGGKNQSRSKSPQHKKRHGRSKSPHKKKK